MTGVFGRGRENEHESEEQRLHNKELKQQFCSASEMVSKLFLGNSRSYHNGMQCAVDRMRQWAEQQDGPITKEALLSALFDIEPPASAAHPTKEQTTFATRKRSCPDDSGPHPPASSPPKHLFSSPQPTHPACYTTRLPPSPSPPSPQSPPAKRLATSIRQLSIN